MTVEPPDSSLRSAKHLPHRILVADDDMAMLRLNAEVLMSAGYEVDAVEDGAAAWQALNAGWYDLLVTDNNMPKVSGVALLDRLRDARMAIPVILVSGLMPKAELERRPQRRPESTLLMPYTAEMFLWTVEEVLVATAGVRHGYGKTTDKKSSRRCNAAPKSVRRRLMIQTRKRSRVSPVRKKDTYKPQRIG